MLERGRRYLVQRWPLTFLNYRSHHLPLAILRPWYLERSELPHHHSERVHVRSSRVRRVLQNLRRHPPRRMQASSAVSGGMSARALRISNGCHRDAAEVKIANLDPEVTINHQVGRLQVAMNDGWRAVMQVAHPSRRSERHLKAYAPLERRNARFRVPLQHGEERTTRAKFLHY